MQKGIVFLFVITIVGCMFGQETNRVVSAKDFQEWAGKLEVEGMVYWLDEENEATGDDAYIAEFMSNDASARMAIILDDNEVYGVMLKMASMTDGEKIQVEGYDAVFSTMDKDENSATLFCMKVPELNGSLSLNVTPKWSKEKVLKAIEKLNIKSLIEKRVK